ncbi:MAG: hypothetical protein EA396_04775 [Anaerolineaceae bacterium]|nr:MAG: hypothetical protein EA396_04775 [Anaerolineaceae bacterium]
MNIINQFSYPLIGFGLLAVAYLMTTRTFKVRWYITTAVQTALIGLLIGGFIILRPGQTTVDSVAEALETIGNGRPTFVEFFSNYCSLCLTLKPVVDQIIDEVQDDYNVIQIDIHSALGRELRAELGFSFSPEFIVYAANGEELWREHAPPTVAVLNRLRDG